MDTITTRTVGAGFAEIGESVLTETTQTAIVSWMFTALSLISRSLTYRFRQRRQLGLKLPHSMK